MFFFMLMCVCLVGYDVASLTSISQSAFGKTPEEKQLSVSGRNWGEVDLNGEFFNTS